jgi:hypothetical protein
VITADIIKSEIADIDLKLASLEPLRKRRSALHDLLQTYSADESQPRLLDAPSVSPEGRFKGMGTTEAITAFLRESPMKFWSPREIAKLIAAGGHESKSPNFFNIVYTICKRKWEGGELEVSAQSGKRTFRLKSISTMPQ